MEDKVKVQREKIADEMFRWYVVYDAYHPSMCHLSLWEPLSMIVNQEAAVREASHFPCTVTHAASHTWAQSECRFGLKGWVWDKALHVHLCPRWLRYLMCDTHTCSVRWQSFVLSMAEVTQPGVSVSFSAILTQIYMQMLECSIIWLGAQHHAQMCLPDTT